MQAAMIDIIMSVVPLKKLAKEIEEYAQICVPQQIKHMKTTWTKWWRAICHKQEYVEEVELGIQKRTKEDEFPNWVSPRRDVGRICRNFDPNYWELSQYINIVGLNESDGSITTKISGLDQLIVLTPRTRENGYHYDASRLTIYATTIQLATCSIKIYIYVEQPEDFEFKLVNSSVVHQEQRKHFVKDKRLHNLGNSLQSLSEVYSPQDIADVIQSARNKLYKIKIHEQHKELRKSVV